jgi:alcohol dehydrogenase (cytochrome c)
MKTGRSRARSSPRGHARRAAAAWLLGLAAQSAPAQDAATDRAPAAAPGGTVYAASCAPCHGLDGRGSNAGPSIIERVTADTDVDLAEFLAVGSPERGMPPAPIARARMPLLIDHLRFLAGAAGADPGTPARSREAARGALRAFTPVTEAMLLDPDDGDWLWFSRTPDAQRFSPLDEIDAGNVERLALAWSRGLAAGLTYSIPLVHDGVMYLTTPDSGVIALDGATGDVLWEYAREYANAAGAQNRSKTLAIYADMVYFTAPDSTLVALDARTGAVRWEAAAGQRGHSAGSIVVEGKVLSAGHCIAGPRDNCFISAHDALTGELRWKFNTVQAPGDPPGFDTWAGTPLDARLASPWGLPGSYDPVTGLVYWGVANPMPNTRAARHGGAADAIPYAAPADLYSNSTVALDPDTGRLAWYYQHLPGDDWDLDMNQERTLVTTRVNPDPEHVRWINPGIEPGDVRDVVVNVGEGGGLWMLDRHTGEFLWATPFPFDVENFFLSDIDVATGTTTINRALLVDEPGERHSICYFNTRSFWPTAYHPGKNALYVPYIRNCLDMTAAAPATETAPARPETRVGTPEPGVGPDELNGLARIDLETGATTHWPTGRIPTNSAMLATAGNLIFWGDIDRRYRALDADTGDVLWETILGGPISMSNITYTVDGRQYVAVIAGNTLSQQVLTTGNLGPMRLDLDIGDGNAALYVFALPANDP